MVLVDTSVWIDFFRKKDSALAEKLDVLLDSDQVAISPLIQLEILGGCKTREFEKVRWVLSSLPAILPAPSTWELIADWTQTAVKRGERFGVVDFVIAAAAKESGAKLWSLDGDFQRMAKLGFVETY